VSTCIETEKGSGRSHRADADDRAATIRPRMPPAQQPVSPWDKLARDRSRNPPTRKRHELRLLEFPSGALVLAAGYIATSEAHLVLMALADHGDYVFGNLNNQIRPWNRTGIRWLSRHSQFNPMVWPSLVDARTKATAKPLQVSAVRVVTAPSSHGMLMQAPTPSY
jgi:hypothetical protein